MVPMHWFRFAAMKITALVLLGLTEQPLSAQGNGPSGSVPNEVVMKLWNAADLGAVAAAHRLDPQPLDQFGARPIYRMRIADGADPEARAGELAGDVRVVYAEPNIVGQAPEVRSMSSWAIGGDAGAYGSQYAASTIRLPEAHQVSRGAGIIVAVLDTGVDGTHPALAGRLVSGFDFVDFDSDPREVGDRSNPVYGHGTHVAGLVALTAPEARIMPLRVLDEHGAGNIWVLAEALAFAADPDGVPATPDGAQVINMSLGTLRRTNLLEEIVRAVTCDDDDDGDEEDEEDTDDDDCIGGPRGIVVTVGAGNSGGTIPEYPAAEAVPGALAAGASTREDTLAAFSTHGPWVPIAAPGVDILSAVPGGGYGAWSGTSMAAPLVAGTAALLRSIEPDLTAVEVANRIVQSSDPMPGPVQRRLNAGATLE
jgi:subtilisin family serine protease